MNIVLLGDSIFDNASYVGDYESVSDLIKRSDLNADVCLLAVDGDVIEDLHEDLISLIQVSEGKQLLLQISREDQVQILAVTPREEEGSVRIGISFDFVYERYPFFEAIGQAGRNTYISGKQVFTSLAMLFSREASFQDLAGPIGLLQMGSAQLTQSFAQFLGLMALISVSLGVINLLPFPVLDGGHILFALIEGVTGRPLNRKVETGLYYVGAALLLTVMVLVIFNDVIHWGARQDILGGP